METTKNEDQKPLSPIAQGWLICEMNRILTEQRDQVVSQGPQAMVDWIMERGQPVFPPDVLHELQGRYL